jgi:hypothetical protein
MLSYPPLQAIAGPSETPGQDEKQNGNQDVSDVSHEFYEHPVDHSVLLYAAKAKEGVKN